MYDFELTNACLKLLKEIFDLKPGEVLAITTDTEICDKVVDATCQAAVILDAKPLVLKMPAARGCGKEGDPDFSQDALVGALKGSDAWIEYNNQWIFYSTVYDRVIEDPDNRPRYMNLVGANPDLLIRNIGQIDNELLREFIVKMEAYNKAGKHFRVTTPAGTDVEFDNVPGREYASAYGYVGKNEIQMMPGQISWAPEFDSINGVIVIDGTISPPLGKVTNPIRMTVEKGYVTKVEGEGSDAATLKEWLDSFDDPKMYLCAHLSYGFGPGAKLSGDIVEDERVWGCTEWGFGNVGPQLVSDIPGGIPAASHSDGICLNSSVWLDGVQILDKGVVVGPTPEIVELARKLGK